MTANPGTEISVGTTPAATPGVYYDLIAGDANGASDYGEFRPGRGERLHAGTRPGQRGHRPDRGSRTGDIGPFRPGLMSLLGLPGGDGKPVG